MGHQTIYLDSPEGNPYFVIGSCLVCLQRLYPNTERCAEVAKDFIQQAKQGTYKTLLTLVEEVSQGTIQFQEGQPPMGIEASVLDGGVIEIQIFGAVALGITNAEDRASSISKLQDLLVNARTAFRRSSEPTL